MAVDRGEGPIAVAIFSTKLTRHRITISPFSAETMANIGRSMADVIVKRIQSATDVHDAPAPPLSPRVYRNGTTYADRKHAYGRGLGRMGVRNWVFGDHLLRTVQAKSASEDRVTVGFTSQRSINIVNGIAKYGQMWGTSPADREEYYKLLNVYFRAFHLVKVERTGQKVA